MITKAEKNKIEKELQECLRNDQEVIKRIIGFEGNPEELNLLKEQKKSILDTNLKYLKGLVKEHNYIDHKVFGDISWNNAFIIVQHAGKAELEFMEYYLGKLEENLSELPNKGNYALLFDRVRVYKGLPQRYGTQGFAENAPEIEDPKNLNKRRKELGLKSYEEYQEKLTKLYGKDSG